MSCSTDSQVITVYNGSRIHLVINLIEDGVPYPVNTSYDVGVVIRKRSAEILIPEVMCDFNDPEADWSQGIIICNIPHNLTQSVPRLNGAGVLVNIYIPPDEVEKWSANYTINFRP